MTLSCSLRKNSRWCSPICRLTSAEISFADARPRPPCAASAGLFHALEHWHTVEHFLQLRAGSRGQRGGEVGQGRWVVWAEAVEVVLQLFAVQRIERQQLLDRIDQGHAIGLHLVGGFGGLMRVVHFHQVGRAMVLEPGRMRTRVRPWATNCSLPFSRLAWWTLTKVPYCGRDEVSK